MGYSEFEFKGGSFKPTGETMERFTLFMLHEGKEVPHYLMLREGVTLRMAEAEPDKFMTPVEVGKLFLNLQGFGLPRRFHSLFFQFQEVGPMVTVKGFGSISRYKETGYMDQRWVDPGYFFKGRIRFLKKSEALPLLVDDASKGFLQRQEPLPLDMLRKLITVEHKDEQSHVRMVRLGKGGA